AEDEKGLQKVYNAIKDVPFPIEMSFGVIHEGKKRGFRFRHKLIDESHPKYERDIFHSARYFDTQVKIFSPYDADAEGVQAESPTGEGKPKTGKPGKENEIKAYVKEKAEGTFETCNALMNPIEKALEGKTDPVDVVVDLSLIPKDDIENNAESWAYLVLLCRKLKNVNFRFELPDLKGKAKKREELQFDIGNMARKGDFEKALRRKIEEKKVFVSGGIDVDELFKTRINNPEERPDRIEIPIWNEEWLEWMKKAGESLKPYQYPVALKEFTTIKNKGVALRNLEAALVIGLAKASMVIARRVGAEELQGRKKSLLKKLNDLYKVIFDDKMPLLELEDLDSMIYNKGDDHGSRVRINDALTFALPPMVRMPLEALSEYQKLIHSYLRAA
ncbi:MAG: hypothetical protein PVH45_04375, partial [Candidatus Omnitrophota bacterium]